MNNHLNEELSAYLDDSLDPVARSAVQAHLDGCAVCRARLGDLRSVSRMLGGLADPAPRRSLVPTVTRPAVWLAPARTFATFASGVFAFLFLVSSVLVIDPTLGGGGPGMMTTSTQRAAQQQLGGARTTSSSVPAPAAAPAIAPNAQGSSGAFADQSAKEASASTAPARTPAQPDRPSIGSPFLWLALTIGAALVALSARRRMRKTR